MTDLEVVECEGSGGDRFLMRLVYDIYSVMMITWFSQEDAKIVPNCKPQAALFQKVHYSVRET